jgi:4-amino-4-deoxy-L-arabinose transferase-like glycosyltransferase
MIFRSRFWLAATLGTFLVGAVIRINNVFQYPLAFGYDSNENWDYIRSLFYSWALPAPDAGWSTAHPPLFYYMAALVARLLSLPDKEVIGIVVRLICTLAGLLAIVAAVALVRRIDPAHPRRAWLCGALILFLPAHIYASAMLGEEVLMASFATLAVAGVSLELTFPARPAIARRRALGAGVLAGLALLTKLTGAVILVAIVTAYAVSRWRRGRMAKAWQLAALATVAGLVVGGWFYARNLVHYGYLYPQNLPVHVQAIQQQQAPPGQRHLIDYVYFPFSTFTHPFAASPDLVRSVWGSTYSTLWYESLMHFIPRYSDGARNFGRLILVLALLPTAAFFVGVSRGVRRLARGTPGPDAIMLLVIVGTLSGFSLFAWRNPWYFVLKGSYLLCMTLPAAYYQSEVLEDWLGGRGWCRTLVAVALGVLFVSVTLTFSSGLLFTKSQLEACTPFVPKLSWR